MGKNQQGHCHRTVSPASPIKLYCCYAVIIILTAAVIALSFALSLSRLKGPLKEQCIPSNLSKEEKAEVRTAKPVISTPGPCYATCPSGWIGFGSKCFYFSEDMRNWTLSQSSCMALGAELARFDNLEELNFLERYAGSFICFIGLHRESKRHPWKWTDNTEYNNLVPAEGEGTCALLSVGGISSSGDYIPRYWICSKSNSYAL